MMGLSFQTLRVSVKGFCLFKSIPVFCCFQTLRVSVKVQEAIQELQEKFEFPNTTCIG